MESGTQAMSMLSRVHTREILCRLSSRKLTSDWSPENFCTALPIFMAPGHHDYFRMKSTIVV